MSSVNVLIVHLVLSLFIARLQAAFLGHRFLQEAHNYWVHPEQLGVHYKALQGGLTVPAAALNAQQDVVLNGTMHLFLKAVKDPHASAVLLRGFAYWDDAYEPHLWADLKLETPKVFIKWGPAMVFTLPMRQSNPRSPIKMKVVKAPDDTKPLGLFAKLPERNADKYVLEVAGWRRTWPLTEVVLDAAQAPEIQQPVFYTVVGQFYALQHPLRYLKLHTDWHSVMGFNGTIMYLHTQHLRQFADDPVGQLLVQQKRAILVRWDVMPNIEERYTYDQGIAHNHALLALWKQNAWAFLTDLDELFSTEVPASVGGLLSSGGCLHNTGDIILLEEYDTLCTACFAAGDEGEEKVWMGDWGLSPVQHYSMRKAAPLSVKGLVNADRTMQWFVHGGHVLDVGKFTTVRMEGTSCAYVTHFRNLIYKRVKKEEANQYKLNVISWQWPVNHTY